MTAHALSSTPNSTDGLCAVEVEMVVYESTTPSLRDTPYSSKQVRKLGEEREPSSRFFLFGSFSFFVDGCGNVEKFLQARRAGLRIPHPDQLAWLTGDIRIRPKPGAKRILRCCPSRTRL